MDNNITKELHEWGLITKVQIATHTKYTSAHALVFTNSIKLTYIEINTMRLARAYSLSF